MNLHELRLKLTRIRFTLVIAAAMALMLYVGFQLATVNRAYLIKQIDMAGVTTHNLTTENQTLITQTNELNAKLEIAQLANEALALKIRESLQRERSLTEQVLFYQKVIAPELSEQGFSIDGIQIATAASENYYTLSMVLIQQTRLKDTISGRLAIKLIGSRNGRPASMDITELPPSDKSPLSYSFKYFQTLSMLFTKPPDFIPERLEISTTIYQYRKRRGEYSQTIEWHAAVGET